MTITTANALFRYFETLYGLNQNLIVLCGTDVFDHQGEQERRIDELMMAVPSMFLLICIADHIRENGHGIEYDLRMRIRHLLDRTSLNDPQNNSSNLLSRILRAYTLKVTTDRPVSIKKLRDYGVERSIQHVHFFLSCY